MIRFHFMNNKDLDNEIMRLCASFNCDSMSVFINGILFENETDFLIFINHYCNGLNTFQRISGCRINRKVSIPETVYHGLKLCHKELDTYSIALIWRSLLLKVVECFNTGGLEAWKEFKDRTIQSGEIRDNNHAENNSLLLNMISNVHIPGFQSQNISKIGFYTFGNEFLSYLRN